MSQLGITIRRLRRAPGFSLLSIATLALGIGMVVAIFTLVYGIVLQELPYPEADRLVYLTHDAPGLDLEDIQISAPLYAKYAETATNSFESLALAADGQATMTGTDRPERLGQARVTPSLFRVLRTNPQLGRALTAQDAEEGAEPVVVISARTWRNRFGSSPGTLDEFLEVDGVRRRVVGILPDGFAFPNPDTELWTPYQMPTQPGQLGSFGVTGYGRLADGVTTERALLDQRRITDDLEAAFPDEPATPVLARAELRPILRPLREQIVGSSQQSLWLALGAVALVLLMACANVANLFLVRAENRQREVALRTALGAGPGGVVLSFLLEGLVLALVGGALGVGVAALSLTALRGFAPADLPRLESVSVEPVVLLFALGTSVLSAVLFTVVPSLQAALGHASTALKDGSRGAGWGKARVRTRQVLVAGQVALAVVLLVFAGLLVRSFFELSQIDLGFQAQGVYTAGVSLSPASYPSENELAVFAHSALDRIAALPEVESVALASALPLTGRGSGAGHVIEDQPLQEGDLPIVFYMKNIAGDYFETLQIPVLEGRALERADAEQRRTVAVVSRTLAQKRWPGESAVGKRIRQGGPPDAEGEEWTEVVGVVADATEQDLRGEAPEMVYYPIQLGGGAGGLRGGFALLVRTAGNPADLGPAVRSVIWGIDDDVPLVRERPLLSLVQDARAGAAFTMTLLILAAAIALFLGALGVYGVVSFLVTLRTQEIGLRLALGARRREVEGKVVRGGAALCALGVLLGLLLAFVLTRFLDTVLYNTSTLDVPTFLLVPGVLFASALFASWLPARRAARIDPATALRWE